MNTDRSLRYAALSLGRLANQQRTTATPPGQDAQPGDGQPEDKPPTLSDLSDRIVKIAAAATALGALTYLLGFVIVNSHYGGFGVRVFDVSLPTYLIAGIGFFVNFVLPCVASVVLIRSRIVRIAGNMVRSFSMLKTLEFASSTRVIVLGVVMIVFNILLYSVVIGLIPVALLEFLGSASTDLSAMLGFPTLGRILSTTPGVVLLVIYAVLVLALGLRAGFTESARRHGLAVFKLMATDEQLQEESVQKLFSVMETQTRAERRFSVARAVGWMSLLIPVMVVCTFLWSIAVYPLIGHAFGGGNSRGGLVELVLKRSDADAAHLLAILRDDYGVGFSAGRSERLAVLEESADALIVLVPRTARADPCAAARDPASAERPLAIRIPRTLITGAVFSRC